MHLALEHHEDTSENRSQDHSVRKEADHEYPQRPTLHGRSYVGRSIGTQTTQRQLSPAMDHQDYTPNHGVINVHNRLVESQYVDGQSSMTIEASSPGRLMLYSHIPPGASHGQLHGQYPTSGDAARSQTQPSITSFHDSFELVQYGLETDTLAPMNEGMLRPEMGGIRLPIQSEPEDNKHVELKTLPRLRHAQRPRMEVKKSPITANRDHGYKICPTCGVSGPEQASQQNLDAVDDQPQPADTNGCRVVGEFDTVVPNSSQRTTSLKTIQSHLNQYASENGLPASLFAQHPWERAPDENPMEPSTRLGYDDPAFSPLESYPHSLGISEAAFIMPGSKNGGTSNPPQSSNTALLQAH